MAKTKKSEIESVEVLEQEKSLEKFIEKVDKKKVESIKKDLENYRDSIKNKEYAVSVSKDLLSRFEKYMREQVQWRSKEALGVTEILKRIESVKKEGIKHGVVYFTNLEIEASHYFILKWEGKGESEIKDFISLWKTFEESLILIHQDNEVLKDLEKQLAAAEQGIELQ